MTATAHRAVRWTSRRRAEATVEALVTAVNPVIRGALYLFVLAIPFEIPQRPIPIEIPTAAGFLFLLASVLQPSVCYRRIPAAVVAFAAYLWVFAIIVAGVGSPMDRPMVWDMFFVLLQLLLIVWVASNVMSSDTRALRGAVLALVVACTARAAIQVLGIATVQLSEYSGGSRMLTLGQNPNLSAIILSAGLVMTIGLSLSRVPMLPWVRRLAWPLAALMGYAIVQTGSRGGLLCAAAGLLTFVFRGDTIALRVRNAILAVVGIAALAGVAWQSDVMRHRFEESMSGHNAGRELIYPAAVSMIVERPLLGWGPIDNQYEIARRVGDRAPALRDAHNLILELFTATGIAGAIPYLLGVGLCLAAAWRARLGLLGLAPFAMLVAALMGSMSGTWIAGRVLWFSMAVALAADPRWGTPRSKPRVR